MEFFKQWLSRDFTRHGFCYPPACGTTHLIEIQSARRGSYLLAGRHQDNHGCGSLAQGGDGHSAGSDRDFCARADSMNEGNRELEHHVAEPEGGTPPIEAKLRRRVAGGFIVALLLTVFIGFLSWRNAHLAADGADWVAHTYAVLDRLELTSKDVIEVESSARTFALTGQDPLRAHYETGRGAVALDVDALRYLTADNPSQQRRLDVLESRIRTALEFAEIIVAKRRQARAGPGVDEILETEKLMDGVRATTQEVKAEEMRLLSQRTQRTNTVRRLTSFII